MIAKPIVLGLLVILISAACVPTATVTPRANNFAFIFKYAPCGPVPMHILDTINGTLVYTPIGDTTSIKISLQLTDDELESIYQKAISIGFFEYPAKFVVPSYIVIGHQTPADSFELSMTNGTVTNSVSWIDDAVTLSIYKKADRLRELMKLINEIVRSHPEVQQLPVPKALCV